MTKPYAEGPGQVVRQALLLLFKVYLSVTDYQLTLPNTVRTLQNYQLTLRNTVRTLQDYYRSMPDF